MRMSARQVWQIARQEAKAGRNPALSAVMERHRREGLGWRYDGLGEWSTEAIFARLQELGVDTDAARFRTQAQAAGRPSVLYERWYPTSASRDDLWDDFPLLAAEELWGRLTPDLLCPEMVASRVDPLIEAASARRAPGTPEVVVQELSAAAVLMDYLEAIPEKKRAERYEELSECSTWDYEEWLLEMVCNYGQEHPDEITRIADVMSGFALNAMSFQGDLAEVLARVGRREEALRRVRRNLERSPDEIQTHIRAGDTYEVMGDFEEALNEFTAATEMARDAGDWDWATDRVDCLLEKAGRGGEGDEFLRQHPCPTPAGGSPSLARPAVAPALVAPPAPPKPIARKASQPAGAAPAKADKKPRGHAPCPCGSGKRYRDCCRKATS